MSVLQRCPSYRESNKGSKERQGPTLDVRFTEVSVKRVHFISLALCASQIKVILGYKGSNADNFRIRLSKVRCALKTTMS